MTLVDSNVLIDIFADDPKWFDWSLARLEEAILDGPLLINDVVYAETSIRFRNIGDFDAALARAGVRVATMPRAALFLAGKVFMQYRRAGGQRGRRRRYFCRFTHACQPPRNTRTSWLPRSRSFSAMRRLWSHFWESQ